MERLSEIPAGSKALRVLAALATLLVASSQAGDVLTYHNNLSRTAAALDETRLNTSNVNVGGFGKLFTRVVDDEVYSQILYVSNVNIPGRGTHNVIYVATVNNSLYAFDADYPDESAPLWVENFTHEGGRAGLASDLSAGGACGGNYRDFSNKIGIVGTPVIDRMPFPGSDPGDQGTIYFVTRSYASGTYLQELHAVNIQDGTQRPGSPVVISASVPGSGSGSSGGMVRFDSFTQNQRPGLALVNGVIYIGWASFCDLGPYHGWVMGYDATTLEQKSIYNDTPDGVNAGIWMGGQAPAADAAGNLYLSTGNGTMGANGDAQNPRNRGMSVMKLVPNGSTLDVATFFTPFNYSSLEAGDVDFGSTGPMLIPDTNPPLVTASGKQGRMYIVNRDAMGGFQSGSDSQIVQSIDIKLNNKIMGSPAYWKDAAGNQRIYIWGANDNLKAFTFNPTTGKFNLPAAASTMTASNPGAMLSLSANGSQSGTGILWAMCPTADANQQVVHGILRAFNAADVSQELWNSQQNSARDDVGNYSKFNPPTVASGRVYTGTFSDEVCVYGLLGAGVPPSAPSDLQAIAASKTQVHLQWTDNSLDEGGFRIERAESDGTFFLLATVPADTTSFDDLTVEPFQTYSYRVRAFTVDGSSEFSNLATVTTDVGTPAPEIEVRGNGNLILSGAASASESNGTDFGTVILPNGAPITKTFEIRNLGNSPLNLTGSPLVEISDGAAGAFEVVTQPLASVPGASTVTFQIRFTPPSAGSRNATVTIANNDPNEDPFTFVIHGEATQKNLEAWWKFNATSGTAAADSSGSGNDGMLVGPSLPVWNPNGRLDGALEFNATDGQSVTVPSSDSLNPSVAITVSAWIRPDQWGDGQNRRVLQKGASDNQYRLLAEGNVFKWDISGIGSVTTALPATGAWSHVAGTYDGSAMNLYVNGTLSASVGATGAMPTTGDPLQISTKNPTGSLGNHFDGLIDDVRIYSRALTQTEIAALAGQTGTVSVTATDPAAQKATGDEGLITFTRTGPTTSNLVVSFNLATGPGMAIYRTDFGLTPLPPNITIPAGQASAGLTVTPIYLQAPTGPLTVQVIVEDGTGYGVGDNDTASVVIEDSPINLWKIARFGSLSAAQSADAEDSANPDGDAEFNLIEFALGHDPLLFGDGERVKSDVETFDGESYLTYEFVRPRPTPAGISYVVESNDRLTPEDWTAAILVPGYPIDLGDGTERVKFRSADPVKDAPAGFLRLRVTRP